MSASSGDSKMLVSRQTHELYAISNDKENKTVDILVWDHETGRGAWLYLPPALALQFAEVISHHARLLSE
jgi:hypothetical protein